MSDVVLAVEPARSAVEYPPIHEYLRHTVIVYRIVAGLVHAVFPERGAIITVTALLEESFEHVVRDLALVKVEEIGCQMRSYASIIECGQQTGGMASAADRRQSSPPIVVGIDAFQFEVRPVTPRL